MGGLTHQGLAVLILVVETKHVPQKRAAPTDGTSYTYSLSCVDVINYSKEEGWGRRGEAGERREGREGRTFNKLLHRITRYQKPAGLCTALAGRTWCLALPPLDPLNRSNLESSGAQVNAIRPGQAGATRQRQRYSVKCQRYA